MPERILFLTGHLAEARLRRVLSEMKPEFGWDVRDIGVQVAALMTADIVRRRLPREEIHADRVLVPGFCAGDLDALSADWGVPVTRGPDDLHDIPEHFGKARSGVDLTRHGVRIFAEIVDAPKLSIEQIVAQASAYAGQGAGVIDLGCLPATPFGHLEEAVAALHAAGFLVSVDSADSEELRRGGRAGADFVLSLSEATLDLADEIAATPILVPASAGDLDSLCRAAEKLERSGRPCISIPCWNRSRLASWPRSCAMASCGGACPRRASSWASAILRNSRKPIRPASTRCCSGSSPSSASKTCSRCRRVRIAARRSARLTGLDESCRPPRSSAGCP